MAAVTSGNGRWWPRLSPAFIDTARIHAGDLIAGAVLFLATSFAVGRVFRYPFDDEVYNLRIVETKTAGQVVTFFLGGNDIHPPLSYLFNKALDGLGAGAAGMRLASLALTLLALLLFHTFALTRLRAGDREPSMQTRLAAVLLFGLCALAVSQGDALRWYPLFAAEVALAVVLYVAAGNGAAQVLAAGLLGLAVSTNFLGFVVAAPFVLYRYVCEKHPLRGDAALWIAGLAGAGAGLVTAAALIAHPHQVTAQLHFAPLTAYLANALGFFGGHALGIGRAWLVVPTAVIAAMAVVVAIDRRRPSDPANLLAMLVAAVLPLPLLGFVDPRSRTGDDGIDRAVSRAHRTRAPDLCDGDDGAAGVGLGGGDRPCAGNVASLQAQRRRAIRRCGRLHPGQRHRSGSGAEHGYDAGLYPRP